jgi:hypothetical protein
MKRAIRLVFTDESEWATFLEAYRRSDVHADDDTSIEQLRACAVALWARERLDRPREEAKKP